MKINVHAGHNPDGMVACGAIGLIKESTEARKVAKIVIANLRNQGHTVYDCTCDNGFSKQDVLNKIIKKCNAHTVDLDVSIHFNSGADDEKGNGRTTGVEAFVYGMNAGAAKYAEKICDAIELIGFKNRGVKVNPGFRVLAETKAPALLIECCFVDDKDDIGGYNATQMANAITKGITGKAVAQNSGSVSGTGGNEAGGAARYTVQVGAFSKKENADALLIKLKKAGFEGFVKVKD